MSDRFCCCTWKTLLVELCEAKEAEIELLMQKSGLPKSIFAGVHEVLSNMHKFCPCCGAALTKGQVSTVVPDTGNSVTKPVEVKERRIVCPECKGKGNFGVDTNGIETKCALCFGEGWYGKSKSATGGKGTDQTDVEKKTADRQEGRQTKDAE